MPITRERKQEMVRAYQEWIEASPGLVLAGYAGMGVRALEDLRRKVREAGGEFHVVKNRLLLLALRQAGIELPAEALQGTTAVGFAGDDAPAVTRAIVEVARQSGGLLLKFGYFEGRVYDARQLERLAELPPLPVMRAQLLGLLQAPARGVASAVAASLRQVATVIKAYSEKQPAQA